MGIVALPTKICITYKSPSTQNRSDDVYLSGSPKVKSNGAFNPPTIYGLLLVFHSVMWRKRVTGLQALIKVDP